MQKASKEDWSEFWNYDNNVERRINDIAKPRKYADKGIQLGNLVQQKNDQYGDAINSTAEFLRLLFPKGIPVGDYENVGTLVRIYDKMKRIANGNKGDENAWEDIAGYGILMSVKGNE